MDGDWVGGRMDVCMKQPDCDGEAMEEPDPHRIHWPPDFARPVSSLDKGCV